MRLLDLFCGAGGAAAGYARAGFDEIVGVDTKRQRHYPYTFIQADAMTFPWDGFDAIHASPPCQSYSVTYGLSSSRERGVPMLISAVRERLAQSGLPYIIENVAGAARHMDSPLMLCGTMFGLRVLRHRLFESNIMLFAPPHPRHPHHLPDGFYCICGHAVRSRQVGNKGNHYIRASVDEGRAAMGGLDWMNRTELAQAIPPAYTEYLGHQLALAVAIQQDAA